MKRKWNKSGDAFIGYSISKDSSDCLRSTLSVQKRPRLWVPGKYFLSKTRRTDLEKICVNIKAESDETHTGPQGTTLRWVRSVWNSHIHPWLTYRGGSTPVLLCGCDMVSDCCSYWIYCLAKDAETYSRRGFSNSHVLDSRIAKPSRPWGKSY